MNKHDSIEDILENIDKKKYQPPENWNFQGARELFEKPEITDPDMIDVSLTNYYYQIYINYKNENKKTFKFASFYS